MKKPRFNFGAGAFCLVILIGFSASALAQDDPNEFNQIMGLSDVIAGTASGTCGWEIVAVRDGSAQQGSDGGQLTIKLNTCRIFQYQIERFPQIGGAGGTTDLEANDLIIVWDEDPGHGSEESYKNFSYTGTYLKLNESEYDDYLELSSTDSYTNWAVYYAQTAGTFTKGNEGTNEHEILHLQHNLMSFTKDDGIDPNDCVVPEQEITYTICWDNDSGQWVTDAYIIDWLPEGVTYPQGGYTIEFGDPNDPNQAPFNIIPPDPGYDPETHSYVWPLDDIGPNASGCVQLVVVVNDKAVPGGILHNVAELYGTFLDPNGLPVSGLLARATKDTNVCCWGDFPDILYVDQNATAGNNTGLNWPNAFLDLQDALAYASSGVCGQVQKIYVAQGTYYPGDDEEDTFALPDGISVYGGFPTGGSAFELRNPKRYVTTLSGKIDDTTRNNTIVTMGHETLLDGFTVTEAAEFGYGVYGSSVDFTIVNCSIEKNWGYGVRAINGNITLEWCTIRSNDLDGVRHDGLPLELIIENCWIRKNRRYGIFSQNSTPTVKNSIVSESDLSEAGNAGIRIINPAYPPVLHNNTFAHNRGAGISFTDNHDIYGDPNNLDYPDVQNCILWYNNEDRIQFSGFGKEHFLHSCIYDPNDPNGESLSFDLNYNFSTNPRLAYIDPNNVRIRFDSPCRDMGNPFLNYEDQLDMDAKDRVYGMAVDVGAYEVVCEDVSNALDWNADGLVNLHEFNLFSRAWLTYDPNHPHTDPNHPSYVNDPNLPGYISEMDKLRFNPICDLDADLHVGLSDLLLFLDAPWLWTACWKTDIWQTEMMMFGLGGEELLSMKNAFEPMETFHFESPLVQEKSAEEQILDLATAIVFLEELWFEEPDIQQEINADDWQRFVDAIYQNLIELQAESTPLK